MYLTSQVQLGIAGTVLCSLIGCGGVGGAGSEAGDRYFNSSAVAPAFQTIPYSLQQSVDDIGWNRYQNNTVDPKTHKQIQAPNTYVNELVKLSYYQDMINIGKQAGTRLHAVAILTDWDYDNTVVTKSKYNGYDVLNNGTQSAHKMWVNPSLDPMSRPLIDSIVKIMTDNAASVEFGMHGVAHEHFTDVHDTGRYDSKDESNGGGYARAEFAHLINGAIDPVNPTWGWDDGVKHMECFKELYERFFPPGTHSFVKSFVAPAHAYYYNQDNPSDPTKTTSDLLRGYGIKYVDNDKRVIFPPDVQHAQAVNPILKGVSLLNRPLGANWNWHGEIPWYGDNTDTPYPLFPGHNYGAIESHFPNLWDSVDIWVHYLKEVNNDPNRYLAKNTAQNHSQYYYNHQATTKAVSLQTTETDPAGNIVSTNGIAYEIDTTKISAEAYDSEILGTLVLKTPLNGKHIASASINKDAQIIGTWEDDFGYGYLVIGSSNPMGRLSKDVYTLRALLGDTYLRDAVNFYQGTFNVFSRVKDASGLKLTVEMYGTQDLHISLAAAPESAVSSSPTTLQINSATWDAAKSEYIVNITATDIQGVTGVITIK